MTHRVAEISLLVGTWHAIGYLWGAAPNVNGNSATVVAAKGLRKYTPCFKKTVQTYFLSELCQISTDCKNFWHKDSQENKLF